MNENLLLGYVIDNKESTDNSWKANIIALRFLILPDFKEVTYDIKDLSPRELEFFGAESINVTEINLIYTKLSSEERDCILSEVNYSDRCCTLREITYNLHYNSKIIYDKDCRPLYYFRKRKNDNSLELMDKKHSELCIVISISNENYEFGVVAYYITKINGYKLNISGIVNINYYCINDREVNQKTWDLAKKEANITNHVDISIESDIIGEYLTNAGEYTIFNNVHFLNLSKSEGDTLIIPKDCKNLYCSRYKLSKFKSIVVPPSLEKFWYYLSINVNNEEDVADDTRAHKNTKFYFSKTAPASQLYVILRDCIVDYYSNCGYCKCAYEKYENKIETAKTVEELLDIINGTDYIKVELY